MKIYKFEEVLNDLMDYFILGDPDCLLRFKKEHDLPDNLLLEFTTETTGDLAVEEGIIVPLSRVENLPYTIYFNFGNEMPELLKEGNKLQLRQDGHCLFVENEEVYLYTMPYLRTYTEQTIAALKKNRTAKVKLPNGWYTVSVLGGLTRQRVVITTVTGELRSFEELEPTFEFIIKSSKVKPEYKADMAYPYRIYV